MSISNDLLVDLLFPVHKANSVSEERNIVPRYTEKTVSGNPVILANTTEGLPLRGLKIFGKADQKQYKGNQLIPYPYTDTTRTINGITFTDNGDGTITINGIARANADFKLWGKYATDTPYVLEQEAYLSGGSEGNFIVRATDNESVSYQTASEIKIAEPVRFVFIRVPAGYTVNNVICRPMVSLVSNAEWELYVGGKPSPSPEYPQEIKRVVNPVIKVSKENGTEFQTVTLPYDLNAIPVASGGNYTDETGQQWICDEIDLERGVYVKRISQQIIDESKFAVRGNTGTGAYYISTTIKNGNPDNTRRLAMSDQLVGVAYNDRIKDTSMDEIMMQSGVVTLRTRNHTDYDWSTSDTAKTWLRENPITVYYVLATPEEISLTQEELAAYSTLTTYKGTTIISAGDVSGIEATYLIPVPKPSSNEILRRWFKQHEII